MRSATWICTWRGWWRERMHSDRGPGWCSPRITPRPSVRTATTSPTATRWEWTRSGCRSWCVRPSPVRDGSRPAPVSGVDVAPTLLRAAGIPVPEVFQGEPLPLRAADEGVGLRSAAGRASGPGRRRGRVDLLRPGSPPTRTGNAGRDHRGGAPPSPAARRAAPTRRPPSGVRFGAAEECGSARVAARAGPPVEHRGGAARNAAAHRSRARGPPRARLPGVGV